MKKIFLIILFIIPIISVSQETWVNRYSITDTIPEMVNCFTILVQDEGYFLISGGGNAGDTTDGHKLIHHKINWNGDVLDVGANSFGGSWTANQMGWVHGAAHTPDGGIVNAGNHVRWAIDGVLIPEDSLVTFGQLVKYENNGDVLWNRIYGDSINFHTFRQIIATSDGGYLTVGQAGLVDYHPQIWVLKLDSLFDVEWERYYGTTGVDDYYNGWHITENFEEEYIISGLYDIQPWVNDGVIIKIDNDGNVLDWKTGYSYQGYSPNGFGDGIIPVSSGGYICSSTHNTIDDNNYEVRTGLLFRLNNELEIIWEKELGLNERRDHVFTKIIELPNENFITTGSTQLYSENSLLQGHITKFNTLGDVIWTRTLTAVDNGMNMLFDIVVAPDGGYAAAGWLVAVLGDDFPGQNDAWVVKVDSMGCLVPGCGDVGIDSYEERQAGFKIYPNPANDFLNIYFKTNSYLGKGYFKLYNNQGQIVKEFDVQQLETTYILDVSMYTKGIYYLTYELDGIGLQTEKLIID